MKDESWALCVRCRTIGACHTYEEKLTFWIELLERLSKEASG